MRQAYSAACCFLVCVGVLFPALANAHSDAESEAAAVIHMSKDGFEPSEITIETGDTVLFENTGDDPHWPASNVHPTHEIYSAFDPQEPIPPGESWSFTFKEAGNFEFHDHFWSYLTGVVHVVGDTQQDSALESVTTWLASVWSNTLDTLFWWKSEGFEPSDSRSELSSINVDSAQYSALLEKYRNLVTKSGAEVAINKLRVEAADNNEVMRVCHDVVHTIGQQAYQTHGSFQAAMEYRDDFCNSGYIHGTLEAYFKHADDPLVQLGDACDFKEDARPFDIWECNHGLGHGFMYFSGGDLSRALELCESTLDASEGRSCQNGAYMEAFNTDILAKEETYRDPADPFSVCREMKQAQSDCYFYAPTYLLQLNENDFKATLRKCEAISESNFRLQCIRGTASEAIKRNMNQPAQVFSLCDGLDSWAKRQMCAGGAVSIYINQFGSISAGKALCKQVPSRYRLQCEVTVAAKEPLFETEEE